MLLRVPFLTVALSLAGVASPQSVPDDIKSLAGISALDVRIEELSSDAIAAGLSKDQLKTDVELNLGPAGIKVGLAPKTSSPFVGVSLKYKAIVSQKSGQPTGFNYLIEIKIYQAAILFEKTPRMEMNVITYIRGISGGGPPGLGRNEVRDALRDLMDDFINDYRAANPKS